MVKAITLKASNHPAQLKQFAFPFPWSVKDALAVTAEFSRMLENFPDDEISITFKTLEESYANQN